MFVFLIWWYLVAYDPSNPWSAGSVIGEFASLEGKGGCEERRRLYYLEHGEGIGRDSQPKVALAFARCEGSEQKRSLSSAELENQKLQAEIENQLLEAEIRRRILKGEFGLDMRSR